jgi:hypothetical protein
MLWLPQLIHNNHRQILHRKQRDDRMGGSEYKNQPEAISPVSRQRYPASAYMSRFWIRKAIGAACYSLRDSKTVLNRHLQPNLA